MNNVTLKHISIVLKKELKDMFRDKKTIIVGVLIPILVFPILMGVMGYGERQMDKNANTNIKTALTGDLNNGIANNLKKHKDLRIISVNDPEKALRDGKVSTIVNFQPNLDNTINKNKTAEISITADEASTQSTMASEKVMNLINGYSQGITAYRLKLKGIDVNILKPISIIQKSLKKKKGGDSSNVVLIMILPMLIALYAALSPMASATDSGAGEKERGTLEPLLSTCVNRTALLWGKCISIVIMGSMGVIASLLGLVISFQQNKNMFGGTSFSLSPSTIFIMLLLGVIITVVFSALFLSISVYARSFKEAQTYLSPMTIIAMVPAYATMMMDAKSIDVLFFNIPIVNIICLMKQVMAGIYNPMNFGITIVWSIVYILLSISIARYMFNREEVIFRT